MVWCIADRETTVSRRFWGTMQGPPSTSQYHTDMMFKEFQRDFNQTTMMGVQGRRTSVVFFSLPQWKHSRVKRLLGQNLSTVLFSVSFISLYILISYYLSRKVSNTIILFKSFSTEIFANIIYNSQLHTQIIFRCTNFSYLDSFQSMNTRTLKALIQ